MQRKIAKTIFMLLYHGTDRMHSHAVRPSSGPGGAAAQAKRYACVGTGRVDA